MKKFLSVLVVVAMLVTALTPAFTTMAAGGLTVAAGDENGDATFVLSDSGEELTATLPITITENPGFSDLQVYVYYTNTEIAVTASDETESAFADFTSVTLNRRSTLAAIKPAFTSNGLTTASTIYVADINVNNADVDGNPVNTTETGLITSLTVTVNADASTINVGDTFQYGVIVVGAYDGDGEDVVLGTEAAFTGTITAANGDPFVPYYEEQAYTDKFTVYADRVHVYEGHDTQVDVGIYCDGVETIPEINGVQNGYWCIRTMVYYLPELSIDHTTAGEIYEPADIHNGNLNTSLNSSVSVVIKEVFEHCGIEYVDDQYLVTVLYYQTQDPTDKFTVDGLLETLTFNLPEGAAAGDEWTLGLATDTGDISDCDNNDVAFNLENGLIKIEPQLPAIEDPTIDGCTIYVDKLTVAEGTTNADVNVHLIGNTVENSANGIWALRVMVYYDPAITIASTSQPGEVFTPAFTHDGNLNTVLTSEVSIVIRDVFTHNGVEFEDGQYLVTVLYFQPDEATVKNYENGILETLHFVLPNDAAPGDEWTLGIVSDPGDVSDCDNNDVPYSLDGGYIRIYGACQHKDTATVTVDPTCTVDGSVTVTCNDCGEIISEEVLPATGHTAGTPVVTTAATCTVAGVSTTYCTVCNEVVTTEVIPAAGHTDGEWKVTTPATYEAEGVETLYCSVCGEAIKTRSIDMLQKTDIAVGTETGKIGATVSVPVTISDNAGVFIAILDVAFNSSVLTLNGVRNGDVFADATNVIFTDNKDGTVTLYFEAAGNADITADGTLCYLDFTVADDAEAVGDYALTISYDDGNVVNYAGNDVDLEIADGKVTVAARETIAAGTAEVEQYKTVKVPVTVSTNIGIWGFTGNYTYDNTVLTFVGVESGLFTVTAGESFSESNGVITVFVENDAIANVTDDGVLYYLVFTAAEIGTSDIAVSVEDLVAADTTSLTSFKIVDGSVDVIACKHTACTPQVTTQPTVTAEGVMSYYCDNCHEVAYTEAIPMLAGITAGDVTGTTFDTISIPVTASTNPGVWAVGMEFAYNTTAFTFKGVTSGLFNTDEFSASEANGVITVYVENDAIEDISDSGVLFYINLTIKPVAAAGDYTIDSSVINGNTINAAGDEVGFVAVDGTVTVTANVEPIISVTPGFNAETAVLDGDVITVTAVTNAVNATAMVVVNGTAVSPAIALVNGAQYYVKGYTSDAYREYTLTITTPDSVIHTFTVKYVFTTCYASEIGPGYTAASTTVRGASISTVALRNSVESTIYITVGEGSTVRVPDTLKVTQTGNTYYFTANYFDHIDRYLVKVTAADGTAMTYSLKFAWDLSPLRDVRGGNMVTSYTVRNNVITFNAPASCEYASFRYIFNNSTTVAQYSDESQFTRVPAGGITYYKVMNTGASQVSIPVTFVNSDNGVSLDYTVVINFVD